MRKKLGVFLIVALPACGEAEPIAASDSCPVPAAQSTEGEPFRYTQIAVSGRFDCMLGNDGSVACVDTELGRPMPLPEVSQAVAIDVDATGGWAVREGGSVLRWQRHERFEIQGVCGASAVTSNRCAIVADGQVRCWNVRGSAKLGATESELVSGRALTVPGVRGAVSLASGPAAYICALLEDGSVTCWGGGPRGADRPGPEPAPVPELSNVRSITGSPNPMLTVDAAEMCAVLIDGSVTCWTHARAPVPVPWLADVISLSVSMGHGCAALGDGSAVCWGANEHGQLGIGTTESSDPPVPVSNLSNVVQIATFSDTSTGGRSCALLGDGTARCWGQDESGSYSDGNIADRLNP